MCPPKTYPPKLFPYLNNNFQSELSAGGTNRDIEKTPKCILTPRSHPMPCLWPSDNDDDEEDGNDNEDDGDDDDGDYSDD